MAIFKKSEGRSNAGICILHVDEYCYSFCSFFKYGLEELLALEVALV
jgi:hypothetical protein